MIPRKTGRLNFKEQLQMARAMKLEEYKAIRANSMKIGDLYLHHFDNLWFAYRDAKQGRLHHVATLPTSLEAIRYAKERA